MILDAEATLCDNQDISSLTNGGATPTILSDFSYDVWGQTALGTTAMGDTPPSDFGKGSSLEVLINIDTAIGSTGSATVQFELVHADNAALSSNLAVLDTTAAIAKATLVAGYQIPIMLRYPLGSTKRFLGIRFTGGGADLNAGKVTAALITTRQTAGL